LFDFFMAQSSQRFEPPEKPGRFSFADAEYAGKRKKTRREVFLEEMELVVPWKVLLKIIEPHYPVAGRGRRPYAQESMLGCT
jgi:IS5 family transposase